MTRATLYSLTPGFSPAEEDLMLTTFEKYGISLFTAAIILDAVKEVNTELALKPGCWSFILVYEETTFIT